MLGIVKRLGQRSYTMPVEFNDLFIIQNLNEPKSIFYNNNNNNNMTQWLAN